MAQSFDISVDREGWWFECFVSYLLICLSAEGVKYVSWPWKSSLRAWSSLTKAFTGNFIYIYISIYTYLYTSIQICIHRGTWTYNTWTYNIHGGTIKLKHLVQKLIRYQHHHFNYKGSLENGLIRLKD